MFAAHGKSTTLMYGFCSINWQSSLTPSNVLSNKGFTKQNVELRNT